MPKRRIEPLVNGRIRLRLLEEADLPMTLAWRNQDHIRRWFLRSDVITPEQHAAWYAAYKARDDDFVFVIEETATLGRPVGQVALYRIDWSRGTAEFGRLLIGDSAAAGHGLATLATATLIDEACSNWGVNEIVLTVLAGNTRALAAYEACGFKETGRAAETIEMRFASAVPPGGAPVC